VLTTGVRTVESETTETGDELSPQDRTEGRHASDGPDGRRAGADRTLIPSTGRREFWKAIAPADPSGVPGISVLLTPDAKSYAYSWSKACGERLRSLPREILTVLGAFSLMKAGGGAGGWPKEPSHRRAGSAGPP